MKIEITEQPPHGHVSVNPNGTLAFVGGDDDYVGPISFEYIIEHDDGTVEEKQAQYEITPSPQRDGWGTGEHHYMLPVGPDGRVITERAEGSRTVYGSGNGWTAEAIAEAEGLTLDQVRYKNWLRDQTYYGGSEDAALDPELTILLWNRINGFPFEQSNWLLLERGHDYNFGWAGNNNLGSIFVRRMRGASPLQPVVIGAWGTGDQPRITGRPRLRNDLAKNIVVRDINLSRGFSTLNTHENLLFENVTFGAQVNCQGNDGLENPNRGFTFRNVITKDVYRSQPALVVDGKWEPRANRVAGMFVRGTVGLLFDGAVWDHIGWAPDFAPNGSIEGGHPPSMFSHNMYLHKDTRDVTMRNSISMRSSSYGAQFRGGAFIDDNLFLDNNIPAEVFGGDYGGDGPIGEYSLFLGDLATVSARRGGGVPRIGALDWGVRNVALLTSMVDNIVAHANDPDDPDDTYMAEKAVNHWKGEDVGAFHDDTVIWRWGIGQNGPSKAGGPEGGSDSNVEGLDPEKMNATTIQRYTAVLLNQETATVDDFGQYLRARGGVDYADTVRSVLGYFRAGFGIVDTAREDPAHLRFVPDPRGDGVRWDNRLNWDHGDLPGTADGDSVDLGGNRVVFGGTVDIEDLAFGEDGKLTVPHGRLRVSGEIGGGDIEIKSLGQLWVEGPQTDSDPLSVTVTSGRFATTADYAKPGDIKVLGGKHAQAILATSGTTFTLDGELIKEALATVGFDGEGEGVATLRFLPSSRVKMLMRSNGAFTPISKFYSGAFGDNTAFTTRVELNGTLEISLEGYTGGAKRITLIEADEIVGEFFDDRIGNVPDGLTATLEETATAVTLVIS